MAQQRKVQTEAATRVQEAQRKKKKKQLKTELKMEIADWLRQGIDRRQRC